MNLLDAIAKSVGSDLSAELTRPAPELAGSEQSVVGTGKPVLQLNPFPITIDPSGYENPYSDSRPDGSYLSLFRFSQLVDAVPAFDRFYSPSGKSTEDVYGKIVSGMTVKDGNPFVSRLKAEAQQKFEQSVFVNMGGIPGNWHPTYAVPDDWYDTSLKDRYKNLEFDLSDDGKKDSPFTLIGAEGPVRLSLGGEASSSASLDPETKIRSITMKYLLVQFQRPWLNSMLFESNGWYVSGQPQGWCSSGRADENPGVLPLLRTGMLLGRDVSIDADWSAKDRAFLDSAKSLEKPLFLGPLAVTPQGSGSTVQVIGWVCSLVPYSPRASDLRGGSILLRNQGAFISRFSMNWQQWGLSTTKESGNFPVLAAKSIEIPPDASEISMKVEIMTFPAPLETWKTIAVYRFEAPVTKCYEITGQTWSANLREISSAE